MSPNAESVSRNNIQPASSSDKSDISTDDFKATAQKNSVFSFGSQWQEKIFDDTDTAPKVLKRRTDELQRQNDELKRGNDSLKYRNNDLEVYTTQLKGRLQGAQVDLSDQGKTISWLQDLLIKSTSADELGLFLESRRIHAEETRLFEEHKRILADERGLSADLMRMYLAERHKVANFMASSAPSRVS